MADDFKPLNLAQLYQGADASVAQAMQTNLMVLQSAHMKQEFDTEDKIREAGRNAVSIAEDGTKSFNQKGFLQSVYQIDPVKAQGFEKSQREAVKTDLETTKLQEDIDEKRMKSAADRLKVMNEASTVPYLKYKELLDGGMSDEDARKQVQPLHEQAIKNVVQSGLFKPEQLQTFKLNPQFDPTVAEAGMRQVLGAKDQLAQYWEEKKFGASERHHAENMSIQIRGQNITIRGQNLTDERARESLVQQGLEVKETGDGNFIIIDKKNKDAESVVDKFGKPVQGKSNLTESQGKALGFGQRAVQAHNLILGLEKEGEFGKFVSVKQGAGNVPLVGGMLEAAINKGMPGGVQEYEQAQRDFVNAVLRPESGATITPAEFDNARKQYFPAPGDTAKTIKQKEAAREKEIETLKAMAGSGAKQFPAIVRPKSAGEDKPVEEGGPPKEGTTGKSKSGRATIFTKGRWEYAN